MAIKQAQYKITLQNGEDIYHFQTDDKMIKILNNKNQVLGTFKEYGMEGKVVTSGSFKSLNITGLYKIKGVSGLPSGFPNDKICILSVRAVGEIGNPELVSYDLISQTGEVYHNTVFGNKDTGWTSGGTKLENTINTIINEVGNTSSLKTKAKTSLVNAVNELKGDADSLLGKFNTLDKDYKDFKSHDHDSRYIGKSGDTMTGHLSMANNRYIRGFGTDGKAINLMGTNKSNDMIIGNSGNKMSLLGKDLTLNGKKVWSEENHGKDSGLDADRLGGVKHSSYARLDTESKFKGSILSGSNVYAKSQFIFGEGYASRLASIGSDSAGSVKIYNGSSSYHSFSGGGVLQSSAYHELNASSREVGVRFKLNSSDKGIGLARNSSSKTLNIYDWNRGKRVLRIGHQDGVVNFEEPISIKGRKLFMQSGTPSGSIPTGSLWIS